MSNLWSFKSADTSDPIEPYGGDTNNLYEIWHSATSKQLYLPRMLPTLLSEGLGLGYQTVDQECGAFSYSLKQDISSVATLSTANNYPVLTILSKDPTKSG